MGNWKGIRQKMSKAKKSSELNTELYDLKNDPFELNNIKIGFETLEGALWITSFILKEKNIILNRKILSDLAVNNPDAFQEVVKTATNETPIVRAKSKSLLVIQQKSNAMTEHIKPLNNATINSFKSRLKIDS